MTMRHLVLAAGLAGLASFLPAQEIRVTNMAGVARKQWVDVAIPAGDAAALPVLCRVDPQGWIAVKGPQVGVHSTLFHVLANLGPSLSVTGRLVGISNDPASIPPHWVTDWVADDVLGVIPVPVVLDRTGVERRMVNPSLVQVESASPVRKVFRLRGRIAGTPLVAESFLYLYSFQDTVKVEVSLVHSDPGTSAMSYDFDLMWLETGEYLCVDWRRRLGMIAPFVQTQVTTHPSAGRWVQVLSGPRTLGRAEQIHVTGQVLCLPQGGQQSYTLRYGASQMQTNLSVTDRVNTLSATLAGPAVAVCTEWQGKWLAFGLTPELPAGTTNGGWTAANQSASNFQNLLQTPADLYVQRPLSLNKAAGSTGAQNDFGAAKGSYAVTVGDPRFLHEMGYSVHGEHFLRPYHHREADGSPLLKVNHPGLQTFNQLINCRTTQSTLGMVCPLPWSWPSSGWSPIDDQHRSQNHLNALLALTGDWSLRAALTDLAEIDKTQVPNRMDSPRGEGRLFMAWANMWLLLGTQAERQALQTHMGSRTSAILNLWLGRSFVGNPQKPVRVLATGSDPTFLEPNGQRVTAIIVWEHSIATMGFYAGWRVTGDPRLRDLAAELSRMIVNHCIYPENGRWIACTAVRYLTGSQEGNALPASSYYSGSPDVHVGVSFWTWILPSVLICRELHRNDAALVARCNAMLQDVAPNGPTTWERAEWWAVLPR